MPDKQPILAVLHKLRGVAGYATILAAGLLIAVFGTATVVTPDNPDCRLQPHHAVGCLRNGRDISELLIDLELAGIALTFLLYVVGLFWLFMVAITEWKNPEHRFLRWWLLLIGVIILFSIAGPALLMHSL